MYVKTPVQYMSQLKSMLTRCKHLCVALQGHHAMLKVFPVLVGMNACISVGKLSEAKQLLQDMKDQSIPLDSRVYNILLKGLSRKGNIDAIPGVLQEMQEANIKPSSVTYNTLINSYVEDAQLAEARRVCASAQDAGNRVLQLLVQFKVE